MKKKTDLQRLSGNLPDIFHNREWHLLWRTCELAGHWAQVAGTAAAAKSRPAYIRKKILWIYVRDSVWMQHLQIQKNELLAKVWDFTGDRSIEDIRWLLQPEEERRQEEKIRPVSPRGKINTPEQKQFEKIASSVKNEQCRDALCKLWQAYHGAKQP
jgi:predicted nucleic acid-binding Zn ribbon protein